MMHFFYPACLQFKPKVTPFVYRDLLSFTVVVLFLFGCAGKPTATDEDEGGQEGNPSAISAKVYETKIIRRNSSGRVYLLQKEAETKAEEIPAEGRILLLKHNDNPVMAFRVLKQYPEKVQFAAKNVRQYGSIEFLENKEIYQTIEKISDIAPTPPTEQDKTDLKELETEEGAPTPDEEPASEKEEPTPEKEEPAPAPEELSSEENQWLSLTADEVHPIDKNQQAIALEFAYLRNLNTGGVSLFFPGGGLRYSLGIGNRLFLSKASPQDGITLDAAAFFYKVLNLGPLPDAYSVAVLIGTLRYTVLLSEVYGFFFYGGLEKNIVLSSAQGDQDVIFSLSSLLPAAGGGLWFQIGPNWEARATFGMDVIGGGIVLRF